MSSYINRLSGVAIMGPVGNYWWSGYPSNVSWAAWNVQMLQDQWAVRVAPPRTLAHPLVEQPEVLLSV
jgi:hypothetical protein